MCIRDRNGVVTWTPGYYGNVKVRVRPISCFNGNVSSSDWVESDIISISPVNERIPSITRTDLPTCPIPVTGSFSTTLESDIPVDWYIKTTTTGVATNSYIKIGTVTFTGDQYLGQDYYQIEANTGTGGLLIPRANSDSVTIYLKADEKLRPRAKTDITTTCGCPNIVIHNGMVTTASIIQYALISSFSPFRYTF